MWLKKGCDNTSSSAARFQNCSKICKHEFNWLEVIHVAPEDSKSCVLRVIMKGVWYWSTDRPITRWGLVKLKATKQWQYWVMEIETECFIAKHWKVLPRGRIQSVCIAQAWLEKQFELLALKFQSTTMLQIHLETAIVNYNLQLLQTCKRFRNPASTSGPAVWAFTTCGSPTWASAIPLPLLHCCPPDDLVQGLLAIFTG